jgi:hypothetical protein
MKGEEFKSSSLLTLRQNLCRSIKLSHHFDIIADSAFTSSGLVFINKLKHLKEQGKGCVDHRADINEDDMNKITSTLSPNNPTELQLLVWFYFQLYFCRRGVENQAKMTKDHYIIKTINGKRCIVKNKDELTKNHRGNDLTRVDGAIITEQAHSKCPVKLFENYLAKLCPKNDFLWQLPLTTTTRETWYHRKAGETTIKNYMKKISQLCATSQIYTNHCVRATSCTILGNNHSDIDIQSVSGHKSISGLSAYKRVNDQRKIQMSNTLSKSLGLLDTLPETDEEPPQTVDPVKNQLILDEQMDMGNPPNLENPLHPFAGGNLPTNGETPVDLLIQTNPMDMGNLDIGNMMNLPNLDLGNRASIGNIFANCQIQSVSIIFNK